MSLGLLSAENTDRPENFDTPVMKMNLITQNYFGHDGS
jgi:hypothetical protein